ncbi:DUF4625 domain-containing protein [Algivirga pacifica]
MIRLVHILSLLGLMTFSGCLSGTSEDDIDLLPPEISSIAEDIPIAPGYFQEVGAEDNAIPIHFKVTDPSGISQIKLQSHSGFDGHSHGRFANDFSFILFRHYQLLTEENLAGANTFTADGEELMIYLDDRNPEIGTGNILAGPYHFSIQATDLNGNESRYADNSTYHTTLLIQRPYAPQIEYTTTNRNLSQMELSIRKNEANALATDLRFVWIYIENRAGVNPWQEGEVTQEWVFGESNWPHQFRPTSGAPLPSTQELSLQELLSENIQIKDQEVLVVWAEDTAGNISLKRIEF